MTSSEIREKFIKFFESHGHRAIPSASLIPENDPTVLFTTAGMQPLVPYLMGEKHPEGSRLVDVQKCVRTDDINEVGDEVHHTFFEMLGNWSLGDYFKNEAIELSWEFLTSSKWMGIDKNKLAFSVFKGDDDAPFDKESYDKWVELGISEDRIAKLTKKHNWWPTGGKLPGPQGPDTEMFFWTGSAHSADSTSSLQAGSGQAAPEKFDSEDNGWVEIWNDVFMQYNKVDDKFHDLPQKNVDTGMGLERMTAVMNGVSDNYQTDLFAPIIQKIEELSTKKYLNDVKSFRIIADHLRAATFIIGDDNGVTPSNTLQGYILRRLIRRAISYGKKIEIIEGFVVRVAEVIIDKYKDIYPELERNRGKILSELDKEEIRFGKSLEKGIAEFKNHESRIMNQGQKIIDAKTAFDLYQSYGFPFEMVKELATEDGFEVDEEGFQKEFEKHQELSRTASAGMFKGGLADSGEETTRLHTAAHLLLASLRKVLGDEHGQINQKGSNITAERLRFDFNYPNKLNDEQLKKIEEMVNQKIQDATEVEMMELSLDDAKNIGATGVFESKYGNRVKVYKIGDVSLEICGGPHAKNTKELGHFKIVKEESSSSGVRRIKAILE